MSFILFSIAVAVVRNLYRAHVGKTNIKKQIKKRFRKVFGDDNGEMDNSSFINNNNDNEYNGPNEESKQPSSEENKSDPKGSVKGYFNKGIGAVMSKFGKAENDYAHLDPESKQGDKDQGNG